MKLTIFHIFLILIFSLIFCCMGFSTLEGNTNMGSARANREDPNLKTGSKHDPFGSNDGNVVNVDQASNKELVMLYLLVK